MLEAMLHSPFFGLTLTAAAWAVGIWVQRRTKFILCNPIVIATALVIVFLVAFRIPYAVYAASAEPVRMMLGPVTAVLALNIYNQRRILKDYFLAVLLGCFAGSLTSLCSVLLLCRLFQMEELLTVSLLPKSVTAAIALSIVDSQGGVAGVAAAAGMITGMLGAILVPQFAKLFHITDPVAEGLAIGSCSHALGTTKAMEIGKIQGAMSSIAICVCGIITSVLVLFF